MLGAGWDKVGAKPGAGGQKCRLRGEQDRRRSRLLPTDAMGAGRRRSLVPSNMTDPSFDCVSCGACCFSRHKRYLALTGWDASRALPTASLIVEGGQTYVKFDCGHCVHLQLGGGKAVCGVYEDRPEACRAFRAGSFECVKARRANGMLGANVRDWEGEPA
jgi:hypothetical protein